MEEGAALSPLFCHPNARVLKSPQCIRIISSFLQKACCINIYVKNICFPLTSEGESIFFFLCLHPPSTLFFLHMMQLSWSTQTSLTVLSAPHTFIRAHTTTVTQLFFIRHTERGFQKPILHLSKREPQLFILKALLICLFGEGVVSVVFN